MISWHQVQNLDATGNDSYHDGKEESVRKMTEQQSQSANLEF